MGMDVHGINPKQNKKLEDFPVLHKYKMMEKDDDGFQRKWKELDADKKLMEKYWEEEDEYNKANQDIISDTMCGGGDHCGIIATKLQMI